MAQAHRAQRASGTASLALLHAGFSLPATAILVAVVAQDPGRLVSPAVPGWAAVIACFELFFVLPVWSGPGMNVAFAAQVTVALLYDPAVAGAIAFLGAFNPAEVRGEWTLLRSWWNRSTHMAMAAAGSAAFHAMSGDPGSWTALLPFLLAAMLMYWVNVTCGIAIRSLESGHTPRQVWNEMNQATPYPFPLSYPGLGIFGLPMALMFQTIGAWPVLLLLGLFTYARKQCFSAWTLNQRLTERNMLLAEKTRKLAYHLEHERQAITTLEALNRTKSQFVAIASHEVRTPLTAIIGYAQTLQHTSLGDDPAGRNRALGVIERQGERLLALVKSLLVASKLESGRPGVSFEEVALPRLFRDVVEGVEPEARRVTATVHPGVPGLVTDRNCLTQVLRNLLENALKYSQAPALCELGARPAGAERVALWVRDHGSGIPSDQLPHIFDRFYQARGPRGPGTNGVGLGLSLVKELVPLLGGTVEVDSREGVGSTFTVLLPVVHPAAPRLAEQPVRA